MLRTAPLRFALTAGLAAFALGTGAQTVEPDRASLIDPEQHVWFPMAARVALPMEMAEARQFVAYNVNLYSAATRADGSAAIHRKRLDFLGLHEDPVVEVSTEGLPASFFVERMIAVGDARCLVLAGSETAGAPLVLYRGLVAANGDVEAWDQLPDLPAPITRDDLVDMGVAQGYALLLGNRPDVNGAPRVGGWMTNMRAPMEVFRWVELPPTEAFRAGATLLTGHEVVLLAGGVRLDGDGTPGSSVANLELLPLSPPQVGRWHSNVQPVRFAVPRAVGASFGMGLYLADRQPTAGHGDFPTSATMQITFDWRQGNISPWKQLVLDSEPAPVLAMTVDPAHSRLLVIEERESDEAPLMLSQHVVPDNLQERVPTREEVLERRKREVAAVFAEAPLDVMADAAREHGQFLLVYLADDDRQSVDVRYALSGNQYRYMAQGITQSFYAGAGGREVARRYGVGSLPAFLLVNPETDEVVTRHEGSIPHAPDFFRLTSPARQPRPE